MDIKDTEEYKSTVALLDKITINRETLEEAAEQYLESKDWRNASSFNQLKNIFKDGAKWQAERSYSEEEVYELLSKFHIVTDGTLKFQKEFFEQFKKK